MSPSLINLKVILGDTYIHLQSQLKNYILYFVLYFKVWIKSFVCFVLGYNLLNCCHRWFPRRLEGGSGFTLPIISSDPERGVGGFTLPIISSDPEGRGLVDLFYLSYQVILRGGSGFTLPIISSDPEGVGGGVGLLYLSYQVILRGGGRVCFTYHIKWSWGEGVGLLYLSYQVILRGGGWVYFSYHIKWSWGEGVGGFTLPIISSDPEGRRGGFALPIISSDPEGERQVHRQGGCNGCECTPPPPMGRKGLPGKNQRQKKRMPKMNLFS